MKSKVLLSLALSLSVMGAIAQKDNVGIGTTKPDQSAVLDVNSSTKGFLTPRMTLQQRNGIQNPAQGLMVYQTDLLSGFYFYDGKEWKPMTSETNANSVADANNWGLLGNTGTTASNYIGHTDANVPLTIRAGAFRIGYFDSNAFSNLFLGKQVGTLTTPSGSPGAIGSGSLNIGIGEQSLNANSTGTQNNAIGFQALASNTSGYGNLAFGTAALLTNTTGFTNTALGAGALAGVTNGSNNLGIGSNALRTGNGTGNIGIGANAGYSATGGGNIFIGLDAGYSATTSNTLYIANSNTTTPLIFGDFTAKYLAVGEVAAADRAAATTGGYRLLVKGGMITEKIKVAVAGSGEWADYVFAKDYKLMPLENVEAFVKENKHLPNVPSADEMAANGLDVMKTNAKLMEKVEELTLYIIELNKEVQKLKTQVNKTQVNK